MIRTLALACLVGLALLGGAARPKAGEVVPWQGLFQAVAGPRWIDRASQVQAESGFDPMAVSPVGAKGLGQAMDPTWGDYIKKGWVPSGSSPFDPLPAIQGQNHYMNWLEPFCGGYEPGLAGYNAGAGNVRKAQRLAENLGMAGSDAWLRALPKVTGAAHAAETAGYIRNNRRFRASISKRAS